MALKWECDSCATQSKTKQEANPELPRGWVPVSIGHPPSLAITYLLCTECARKPMTFGDITSTRS